jgi:hypothetical protein
VPTASTVPSTPRSPRATRVRSTCASPEPVPSKQVPSKLVVDWPPPHLRNVFFGFSPQYTPQAGFQSGIHNTWCPDTGSKFLPPPNFPNNFKSPR